jgi:tetratricopeptide (TPR) repeat protein
MPKKLHSSRKGPQGRELRDLDLEIRFLEGIVRRDPGYVEALQILGDNYTRRGLYVEGLKIDERLVRLRPDDSIVHYNLACSYSRTRQIDAALDSLRAAVKLGYRDFKAMDKDPDLANLREHAEYKRLRARMRKGSSKLP